MASTQLTSPIIDGFMYNAGLVFAPCRSFPLILDNIGSYRDTHLYRHRWYTAPVQPTATIAAGNTLDTQITMPPGSVIMGVSFSLVGATRNPAGAVSLLIRDVGSQTALTQGQSRYISANTFYYSYFPLTSGFRPSGPPMALFLNPFVTNAGFIVVSIANQSTTTAISCQLLITVLEPVNALTSKTSGSIATESK